jgi:hypothetical protein
MDKLKRRFEARRINYYQCDNEELKDILINLINQFSSDERFNNLGFTDCQILREIKLYELIKGNISIDIKQLLKNVSDIDDYNHYVDEIRKYTMVDIFITQADGITVNGEILFRDEIGNKIAGTIFGPQRVIIILEKNIVYKDINDFIENNNNSVYSIIYGSMEGHKDRIHLLHVNGTTF